MIIEFDAWKLGAALIVVLVHVIWQAVMCRSLEQSARVVNFYPHMAKIEEEDVDMQGRPDDGSG